MDNSQPHVILVDVSDESREVLVRRLNAQGYSVEAAADPATGADMALACPPAAVIADLWMPSISGIQLCRLLRSEPATAEVPVVLRGETDDPRNRFWAERAGAVAYVRKGRMGELVRVLSRAISAAPQTDGFFMQLSGGSMDIRDRIAKHLDAALFESVIAAEVRALASCGSFDRLFDLFSQFLSQVIGYRWLAISAQSPEHFALHYHPQNAERAEAEARAALRVSGTVPLLRVADEDARYEEEGPAPIVCKIPFGSTDLGSLALAPSSAEPEAASLARMVARELGGPIRIASLMDESQRLAAIDPLTSLMNRRSFLQAMQTELARSKRYNLPLAFLLLDVDHFKQINDKFGHACGDQVLSGMGALLREQLRASDMAARWGGEEFVVTLTNTDLAGASVVAERIRGAVQELVIHYGEQRVPVTASVGVTELLIGDNLDGLIDRADRAMYTAKVGGRNRVMLSHEPGSAVGSVRPALTGSGSPARAEPTALVSSG